MDLTLTRVVFEYVAKTSNIWSHNYLTLTRVVFE